ELRPNFNWLGMIQFSFGCNLVLTCCLFIAGLKLLLEVTGVMPGTREECLSALKNGHLVSISPGGVREALFSDESYQLMWGNRKGFAQVALDAKVVIFFCLFFIFMIRTGFQYCEHHCN
uniref:Uncharacterized protein n=1 Tax=Pavo cristatus TaxID=9049 RepID=A0A8C9EQP1_PAVCR